MIYFYYGTDTESARKKAKITIDSLLIKKPDATLIKIGDEDLSIDKNSSGETVVSVQYQVTKPLAGNISVLLDFSASSDGK